MTHVYEGSFDGRRLRIGIVVARFNESVGMRLLDGALDGLKRHGVSDDDISIAWVPGAFEIPLVAERLASSGEFDALVCLGAVIRGETAHFDYVAGESAAGISTASRKTGIPIANGILTTEDADQAIQRAGGKAGNKGFEAALAALEMANLLASLPKPSEGI
ncbi:MAG: 6,7-dimethyl-8-ribityllumazine synthase [Actinobacteria bacterium]|nr:6,7-dimethyl-8-ribityllumazine synthase [Actinomycetota bacterium]